MYTCRGRALEDGKTEDTRVVVGGSCRERMKKKNKNVTGEELGDASDPSRMSELSETVES